MNKPEPRRIRRGYIACSRIVQTDELTVSAGLYGLDFQKISGLSATYVIRILTVRQLA